MNFYRLVHSLEELVFQFSVWLLLLPKTFVKIIRHPSWIYGYVKGELAKEHDERFQGYLSPILFWIIVTVIPFYYLGFSFFEAFLTEFEFIESMKGVPMETTMFGIAVFLLTGPLTLSVFLEKLQKEEITYTSIRDTFYTQVYVFAPAQLITGLGQLKLFEMGMYAETEVLNDSDIMWMLYFFIGLLYSLVWFYQQYQVFRQTLNRSWIITILLIIAGVFLSYLMLFLILVILMSVGYYKMELN